MNSHKKWKNYLQEILDQEDGTIDTSQFEAKDELHPDFWQSQRILDSNIANNLYAIAQDFFKSLNLNWVELKDVTLTGSIANYTWSKYSDVDLHIILNFQEIDENLELVREYLRDAGSLWNKTHNIKIKGFDVEIYVQDYNEPHHSTGVYSVLRDTWIAQPIKTSETVDHANIHKKSVMLMDDIDEVYEMFANKEYKGSADAAERLRDKIRKFRQAGLERGGAYSVENLTFKVLRRNEYLKRLASLRIMSYDKLMSLNGNNHNI
tara:strand:+ start:2127 stop:2918 length:792 start_codon:yes stop_codon:yes gene_type:complete